MISAFSDVLRLLRLGRLVRVVRIVRVVKLFRALRTLLGPRASHDPGLVGEAGLVGGCTYMCEHVFCTYIYVHF